MAATNIQMAQLASGPTFQGKVSASIYKKALSIIEDVLLHGVTPTGGANYSAAQNSRARSVCSLQNIAGYYGPMACSTNVIASTITVVNGETLSDITDAGLDSQVYTVVFVDLV